MTATIDAMSRRDRHHLLWLGAASCVCLLAELVGLMPSAIGYVAPVLILALPLLARRYPGEDVLVRLATRGRRPARRRRAPVRPALPALRAVRVLPRGGRLIAAALAVRPPPVAAGHHR